MRPAAGNGDRERARSLLRGHVAYYVGSGEGYRRSVAAAFPEAEEIAEAWRAGERDRAREAVTEEMVDALGAGAPEEARERFQEIAGLDPVDKPILVVPESADREVRERTIETLAPEE